SRQSRRARLSRLLHGSPAPSTPWRGLSSRRVLLPKIPCPSPSTSSSSSSFRSLSSPPSGWERSRSSVAAAHSKTFVLVRLLENCGFCRLRSLARLPPNQPRPRRSITGGLEATFHSPRFPY